MTDFNEADVAFIQGMIPHHEAAIVMAAKVLKSGQNAEVKALAKGIVSAQDREISQMEAWLKAREIKAKPGGGMAGM